MKEQHITTGEFPADFGSRTSESLSRTRDKHTHYKDIGIIYEPQHGCTSPAAMRLVKCCSHWLVRGYTKYATEYAMHFISRRHHITCGKEELTSRPIEI